MALFRIKCNKMYTPLCCSFWGFFFFVVKGSVYASSFCVHAKIACI